MKLFILSLLSVFIFQSCNKVEVPKNTPSCIKKKIQDIKDGEKWNPAAKIYSYTYNGQTVYYFPSHCCDIPSVVYDANCNVICSPDGGLTGSGDGQCTDFFSSRTNESLIWKDNR